MLTEDDCRELHIPITPRWGLHNSPLVAMHDRSIGGITTFFLAKPGGGKTRASYLRAWRMYQRERLFIRGLTKNQIWHWRFGNRAVVWVPSGTTFKLLEAAEYGGREIPVRVETYQDIADLLERAKVGNANVLYWAKNGADRWGGFLQGLLQRKDRLAQLVFDDEVQAVAPQGATNMDGSYLRVRGLQEWMREARESEISTLFSTQIDYQMDYNVGQLGHFYVFLVGARIPDDVTAALPRRPGGRLTHLQTSGLRPGDGFVVGRTDAGYFYQPVRFKDHLRVRCKTRVVVEGPPEPPPPHRPAQGKGSARTAEDNREIARLCALGLTQEQIERETGWGRNTIQRAYSELRKSPKPPKRGGEGGSVNLRY